MIEWTALIPYVGIGFSLWALHAAKKWAVKRVENERKK
jgi:hypothetical protein